MEAATIASGGQAGVNRGAVWAARDLGLEIDALDVAGPSEVA